MGSAWPSDAPAAVAERSGVLAIGVDMVGFGLARRRLVLGIAPAFLVLAACGKGAGSQPSASRSPNDQDPPTASGGAGSPTSPGDGANVAGSRDVTTYRYDNTRIGLNDVETALTPATVAAATFGKLFSHAVDGQVYAQPLYLRGVNVPGAGVHDVVFVATEHDSVYAFDAEDDAGANAAPLWKVSLIDGAHGAAAGATTVPAEDLYTDDISPEIGITGTPVIDEATGTLHVASMSKENGGYTHRLHALDVATGDEKLGGPVVIDASVNGTGTGSAGGAIAFDSMWANQRPALTLAGGIVYIAFASFGDHGPYHGWVIGYDAATLRRAGVWNATPAGSGGGIWMAGCGVSVDADGNGFLSVGNGTFTSGDYGDSVVKLAFKSPLAGGGTWPLSDSFTPYDQAYLADNDLDLGSTGVTLLPDQPGSRPHLAVTSSKAGRVYVLDRDALGGFNATGASDSQIVQSFTLNGAIEGTAAYWNGRVYIQGRFDPLRAFDVVSTPTGARLSDPASSVSSISWGFPSPSPVVSASGSEHGMAWTLDARAFASKGPAVLRAFDANDVSKLLWSSDQNPTRDSARPAVKFAVPVVVNGKVYVGGGDGVTVYGILPAGR